MAFQYSTTLRTAQCEAIATAAGSTPKLKIYSGGEPADCGTGASGTLLVDTNLPATAFAAASNGAIAKTGTWSGTGAAAASTGTNAGYFRITTSADVVVMQGNITATAGGGDMTLDNISIAQNQTVTVTGFQITAGNA